VNGSILLGYPDAERLTQIRWPKSRWKQLRTLLACLLNTTLFSGTP